MDTNFGLRQLQPKDAERMLEWMHNDDIIRYLRLDGKNATINTTLEFIKNASDKNADIHYAIVDNYDKYLGTISLKNIEKKKKEAEYAICMHPDSVGTGAASVATKQIVDIAVKILHLNNIYLNVLKENKRAVRFYEKYGFYYMKATTIDFRGEKKVLLWYQMKLQ